MKRVSDGEDKNILEPDGGDGCTMMWMSLMPLNLKLIKMVHFMQYIFYLVKNIIKLEKKQNSHAILFFRFKNWLTLIFLNFVSDGTQYFWVWGNKVSHMLLLGVWIRQTALEELW